MRKGRQGVEGGKRTRDTETGGERTTDCHLCAAKSGVCTAARVGRLADSSLGNWVPGTQEPTLTTSPTPMLTSPHSLYCPLGSRILQKLPPSPLQIPVAAWAGMNCAPTAGTLGVQGQKGPYLGGSFLSLALIWALSPALTIAAAIRLRSPRFSASLWRIMR